MIPHLQRGGGSFSSRMGSQNFHMIAIFVFQLGVGAGHYFCTFLLRGEFFDGLV